ncbi:MAG: zf-HC2 domain-containing protein [Lachnospiraceae bacterium]|nr:zf-HC2 domain-containing protein [Lachnospiraceae bacterium]
MKYNCNLIRDLLPLYQDQVVSEESAAVVREHLLECPDCRALLRRMEGAEIESAVAAEKQEVLREQNKYFKRKSTLAGTIIAGIFMIPILVCLIVNLATGHGLSWFFIVLAALLLAASLIIVPIMVRENKALWTFVSSTASLILLLAVVCIYSGGSWFFVAALSTLFGLSVVFLPFVVRSKPVAERIGNNKALVVLAVDTLLFFLMMLAIGLRVSDGAFSRWFWQAAVISGPFIVLAFAVWAVLRYLPCSGLTRAGIVVVMVGLFEFFATMVMNLLLGAQAQFPVFRPLQWNVATVDGNTRWITLLSCVLIGAVLIAVGLIRGKNRSRED